MTYEGNVRGNAAEFMEQTTLPDVGMPVPGLQPLRIERVLEEYARGGISFGAAAHQAGVSQSELARCAYARGMEPPFSADTLTEELS